MAIYKSLSITHSCDTGVSQGGDTLRMSKARNSSIVTSCANFPPESQTCRKFLSTMMTKIDCRELRRLYLLLKIQLKEKSFIFFPYK